MCLLPSNVFPVLYLFHIIGSQLEMEAQACSSLFSSTSSRSSSSTLVLSFNGFEGKANKAPATAVVICSEKAGFWHFFSLYRTESPSSWPLPFASAIVLVESNPKTADGTIQQTKSWCWGAVGFVWEGRYWPSIHPTPFTWQLRWCSNLRWSRAANNTEKSHSILGTKVDANRWLVANLFRFTILRSTIQRFH